MLTTVMSQYMGPLLFLSDSIGDCLSRRLFHKLRPGTAQERAGTLCNAGNEEEADYPVPCSLKPCWSISFP